MVRCNSILYSNDNCRKVNPEFVRRTLEKMEDCESGEILLKKSYDEKQSQIESWLRITADMDDDSLLREMEEAEREWEQEKALHPEAAERIKQEARLGASLVMAKVEAEKEREYRRRQTARRKQVTKVAALTVVIGGMLAGGISSAARSEHQYQQFPGQKKGSVLVKSNVPLEFINDKLDEAYELVYQKLDIPVLVLDYMPDGMKFDKIEVKKEHIVLKFSYKGQYIYLKEDKDKEKNTISVLDSDRDSQLNIYNGWIEKYIYLEENQLDTGDIEYSVGIEGEKAFYYFSGVMEKKEFIEIVRNLKYQ